MTNQPQRPPHTSQTVQTHCTCPT